MFTVPEIATPPAGARVMDLADPTRKMSKSADAAGSVFLLDPPDVVRRKIARAVTDSDTGPSAVRADRSAKPGVTNLIEILEACGGSADGITTYGALKAGGHRRRGRRARAAPGRYADLAADATYVAQVFADGADRCRQVTAPVLAAARAAIGLG